MKKVQYAKKKRNSDNKYVISNNIQRNQQGDRTSIFWMNK
jgi:hypothetical protein